MILRHYTSTNMRDNLTYQRKRLKQAASYVYCKTCKSTSSLVIIKVIGMGKQTLRNTCKLIIKKHPWLASFRKIRASNVSLRKMIELLTCARQNSIIHSIRPVGSTQLPYRCQCLNPCSPVLQEKDSGAPHIIRRTSSDVLVYTFAPTYPQECQWPSGCLTPL